MIALFQVVSETLRLGNIIKFVHRKAVTNVQFKGKHIFSSCDLLLFMHNNALLVVDNLEFFSL